MSLNSFFSNTNLTRVTNNKRCQRAVSALGNSSSLLPIMLLELSVEAGRGYQAQKRGGIHELRETMFEETTAGLVWMFGVQTLNKIGDSLFKRFANIDTSLNWKQIENFAEGRVNKEAFINKITSAKFTKLLFSTGLSVFTVGYIIPKIKQKMTKDYIEKNKSTQHSKPEDQTPRDNFKQQIFSGVMVPKNITQNDLNMNRSKKLSFTGVFNPLKVVGNAIENEAIAKCAVVDTGVTGGRLANARNKDEAVEIGFREISSFFFYFFTVPCVPKILSKLFDSKLGISTTIDSKLLNPMLDKTKQQLEFVAKNNTNVLGIDDIREAILGKENHTISKAIKQALNSGDDISPQKVDSLICALEKKDLLNIGTLTEKSKQQVIDVVNSVIPKSDKSLVTDIAKRVEDFIKFNNLQSASEHLRHAANLLDDSLLTSKDLPKSAIEEANTFISFINDVYKKAQSGENFSSSELKKSIDSFKSSGAYKNYFKDLNGSKGSLENIFKDACKVIENNILPKAALANVDDLVKGGIANDQNFIAQMHSKVNSNLIDPKSFVSNGNKKSFRQTIEKLTKRFVKDLEQQPLLKDNTKISWGRFKTTFEDVGKKFNNKNFSFKTLYLLTAYVISALFLGIIIPKSQQLITQLRTGEYKFPGVQGLLDEDNDNVSNKINLNTVPSLPVAFLSESNPFKPFMTN